MQAQQPLIPGETTSSILSPGQAIELEVDLNKMNWGKAIHSSWPEGTISENYEAGDYEVSFRMNVRINETSEKIESNKVKVSIK